MQQVGIDLILKENVADRLGKILPILQRMDKSFATMNKTLSALESSQKRVDSNFKNIGRTVDTVTAKERGLRNLNTGVQGIGRAASGAQSSVVNLGRAFDALMVRVLPLIIAMKSMQALGAAAGEGLNFQDAATAIRNSGFSSGMSNKIIQRSIDMAAQGGSILSPEQSLMAAKGSKAFFSTEQEVYEAMPEYARVAGRARRAGVKMNQPEVLGRIWELMNKNVGPVKDRVAFDNLLLAGISATSVTPSQLLYQMSVAGGSLAGSNPEDALRTLLYMTKESGAGIGGAGGGGRGRAGQRFAAIKDLARGQMPVAVAASLYEKGYLPGLGQYLESHGSTPSSTVVKSFGSVHAMWGRGGSGRHPMHLTKTALNKLFLEHPPDWARKGQEDMGAITTMLLDVAAQGKGFKGTTAQRLNQFSKLSTGDQAQAISSLGLNRQVSMAVVQLVAGKFKTSVDNFQKAIDDAFKQQQKDTPKSIEQRWEELGNQLKAVADAIGNSPEVIKTATSVIDGLSKNIALLNDNVGPIAKVLGVIINNIGESLSGQNKDVFSEMSHMVEMGGVVPGRITGGWKKTLASGVHDKDIKYFIDAGKRLHAPPAVVDAVIAGAMAESSLDPNKLNSIGARGYRQFMPFGKGNTAGTHVPDSLAYSPDYAASSFISNLQNAVSHKHYTSWGRAVEDIQHSGLNSGLTQNVNAFLPLASAARRRVESDMNITLHNHNYIGNKKIDEHIQHVSAKHSEKTAQRFSNSGSGAGGATTPGPHTAGGDQF